MIIPAAVLLLCTQYAFSGAAIQPIQPISVPKIMNPTTNEMSSYKSDDNKANARREIEVLQRLITAFLNHTTVNAETNNLQGKLEASKKEKKKLQEENNLLSQNSSECNERINSLSSELAFTKNSLQELQVEMQELSQHSSQCFEKTNSLSQELQKLEEENEKFISDSFSLMSHIHRGHYEVARKIYYNINDTTFLSRIMSKTEIESFDAHNVLHLIFNLKENDFIRELNNLFIWVEFTDHSDPRKLESGMQKEAIAGMKAEIAQIMNMFTNDSNVNKLFIKFPQVFNFFANDFIKAKYNAVGNDMDEMVTLIKDLNSTEFSAISYFTLYNYLDNTQSFNLCDRIQLLTAVKNFMRSQHFTSVSKSTQEKLSALVEGLPQSMRELTGVSSLHISDRNETASLVVGEAERTVDSNLRLMVHVSSDVRPTEWTFFPETNKPCEFRIRISFSYGHPIYAAYLKYNEDQRRVFVWPQFNYDADAVWRLKDFDWRNDLYTLYNIHYDGNLNIDVDNKLAYTSIKGKKDNFNVVKLH